MDKIKYILSQPEEEKNPTESNRSNYDDEYSNNGTNREDMDSCRDNIQSCRSNKTEQCMNLNDLVVEMYEELHMIVGALPNLENMRAKVKELVENFSLINETLVKYQIEMKEIVSEEVEKMKKELVFAKKDAGLFPKEK